jgi:mannosyltransferase
MRQGAYLMDATSQRSASDVTARPEGKSRLPAWLSWALPALAAATLGLYRVGGPMLWRDELATWSAASRTLPQLWTMVHHVDAVLGVYYFALHLWMTMFGDSATAMRLPSVVAMTGAAAVVALTGKRIGGPGAGLAGGLVFALIPSVSRYAQEARPYALAAFFAALATLLLLRAVEHPRWHRWGGYALALAAAGAFNLVALCVLAGHAVPVLTATRQRRPLAPAILAGFCSSAIIAIAVDLPIVIEGHSQSLSQIGRQPTPTFAELTGLGGGLWPQLFSSSQVAVAILLLAVASAVAPRRVASWYGLAFATAPIAAVWLVSQGPASYWVIRYLLFTVPAWALAAGLGVAGLAERAGRLRLGRSGSARKLRYAVATGLVIAVGLLAVHDQWAIRQPEAHNFWAYPFVVANGEPVDYQGAAEVIAARERPGDGIVFQISDHNHYQVDTSVAYYLGGKPMPRPVFQAETPAQAGSLQPVECQQPARCFAGTPRLWLVYVDHLVVGSSLNPFLAIPPDEAAVLHNAGYRISARYQEDGISVVLMVSQ